jgi:hypothetical protein
MALPRTAAAKEALQMERDPLLDEVQAAAEKQW